MSVNLASEIIADIKKKERYKKKMDTHRMAEANKAFSHISDFNKIRIWQKEI